jgi:hypothetical protein
MILLLSQMDRFTHDPQKIIFVSSGPALVTIYFFTNIN